MDEQCKELITSLIERNSELQKENIKLQNELESIKELQKEFVEYVSEKFKVDLFYTKYSVGGVKRK